ncbi:MAG: type II toxin-antitoxin system RelB/DinJ family antitoxin [Hominenteromicrobium sp.]|uniref:type II toxin-antitoxin system RelB/DinJ family antitoxin n=1 Tax=Hominenteromicrobium sp. TaxID=3073581 RepID=UPI003996238A
MFVSILRVKEKAESILTQLGISPTSAIRMFYSQIVRENGLPLSFAATFSKPHSHR